MNFNDPETKRKVKNLANQSLKSKPSWLFPPENSKPNFDPKLQIGPYNTASGFPDSEESSAETKEIKKPQTSIEKLGSAIKKYIPLKKFMRENYLQEKRQLGRMSLQDYQKEYKQRTGLTHWSEAGPQGGFSIPFGPANPAGIIPWIPDIIDFSKEYLPWDYTSDPSQGERTSTPESPGGGGGPRGQNPQLPQY